MKLIALAMLIGDRTRFFGIVIGLAFASLLMIQQGGIFRGVMVLVYGHVTDTPHGDIWVSDPGSTELDTSLMLNERELDNVRSVAGVEWAVPVCRRMVYARDSRNNITPIMALGIDDATLIGGPRPDAMVEGDVEALRGRDGAIVDVHGARTKLRVVSPDGGSRPLAVGDALLINGRRITVVGLCRSSLSLLVYPTVYLLRSDLSTLAESDDGPFNFILVGSSAEADQAGICRRIGSATGLVARTRREQSDFVYDFYLRESGITENFAITVLLGFLVGASIAGQTFLQFVNDNRRVFASLKAIGMRNRDLMRLIGLQAMVCAVLGYGLGAGMAVLFQLSLDGSNLSMRMEPGLLLGSFAAVLLIGSGSALLSLRMVLRIDPAQVFRS